MKKECMQKTILINFDVNENFVCYSQIKLVGILRYDVLLPFRPFSSSIHQIFSMDTIKYKCNLRRS